jgi:hypothetical protein
MPDQDAVLAITSGLRDMQPPLNLVWEHLLPAMGATPLPDNPWAHDALAAQLTGRQLPVPQGQASTQTAEKVSGKRFVFGENATRIAEMRFDFAADETTITFVNDQGEQPIPCGHGQWHRSMANLGPLDVSTRPAAPRQPGPWQVGASGAWTDDTTYTAKLWWYETPFARTLTCHFANDRLTVEYEPNAGFGPLEATRLEGRLIP